MKYVSTCLKYLHDFEERLDGLCILRELLYQMGLHLSFTWEDGVLSFLVAQADLDGVKVLIQLLELQLAFRDLVKGDTQQTVLMDLTDVVKPWRRNKVCSFSCRFYRILLDLMPQIKQLSDKNEVAVMYGFLKVCVFKRQQKKS